MATSPPGTDTDRALKDIQAAAAATAEIKHAYPGLNVMADLKTPPLTFRPKGGSVLDTAPVAAPMPLTHAQAAMRLRALTPAAFDLDALACMDYVRGRFPEYVSEDKLAELAGELTRRFAPAQLGQPVRVLAFNGGRQTAQGGAS